MVRRSRLLDVISRAFAAILRAGMKPRAADAAALAQPVSRWHAHWVDYAW